MPKGSKPSFYAVHIGHKPGIYSSWCVVQRLLVLLDLYQYPIRAECEQQIKGYPKAAYKKFPTETEAKRFVEVGFPGDNDPVAPPGNTVPSAGKPAPAVTVAVEQSAKEDVEDESGWDVVYTNGACPANGKPGAVAGVGVWWGVNDPR
jgi:ribonuclease HI